MGRFHPVRADIDSDWLTARKLCNQVLGVARGANPSISVSRKSYRLGSQVNVPTCRGQKAAGKGWGNQGSQALGVREIDTLGGQGGCPAQDFMEESAPMVPVCAFRILAQGYPSRRAVGKAGDGQVSGSEAGFLGDRPRLIAEAYGREACLELALHHDVRLKSEPGLVLGRTEIQSDGGRGTAVLPVRMGCSDRSLFFMAR